MRGRGLKPHQIVLKRHGIWSPPMRGRGLKRMDRRLDNSIQIVAPHAGAWIETPQG